MKKYLMNKNVMHGSKSYPKDSEIRPSDEGFDQLVKAGHAVELNFKDESSGEGESVSESLPEADKSVSPKKGKR